MAPAVGAGWDGGCDDVLESALFHCFDVLGTFGVVVRCGVWEHGEQFLSDGLAGTCGPRLEIIVLLCCELVLGVALWNPLLCKVRPVTVLGQVALIFQLRFEMPWMKQPTPSVLLID